MSAAQSPVPSEHCSAASPCFLGTFRSEAIKGNLQNIPLLVFHCELTIIYLRPVVIVVVFYLILHHHKVVNTGRDLSWSSRSTPTLAQSRVSWSRLLSQLLNTTKDGDSTTTLKNLCQCMITPTVIFFLVFKWNSLYFSVCSLPLVFSMGTTTVPAYGLSTLGIPFPFFWIS